MPMPHVIQKQIIKKRLKGKDGKVKIREIEKIKEEIPDFQDGPYRELRIWLDEQKEKTKTRSKIKHQDWLGVKRQGEKQFVLVGLPSAGKSSLIKKLSGLQTKIAEYAFTTLKPKPAVISLNGAEIQLVDLPGLIEGASEDAGGGKRLLGIVRDCDGIIFIHDLTRPVADSEKLLLELEKSNIDRETLVVGNKADKANQEQIQQLKKRFPNSKVLTISVQTEEGIDELKKEIWERTNLLRAFPREQKTPVILSKGSTIEDFVNKIHTDIIQNFKYARVTGKSSKFPKQQVGLKHILEDEDVVELVLVK